MLLAPALDPRRSTTHALRLLHAIPRLQLLRVLLPLSTDRLAGVAPVLREDVVPHDPRRDRDVDERELVAEEVRPLHLGAEGAERGVELLEVLALLRGVLRLHGAHEGGHDLLLDVVDPDADERAREGVGREDVGRRGGERVLEELAEDEGLVQGLALILDGGDEAFRVNL